MIGILCSNLKEKFYVKNIFDLHTCIGKENYNEIAVFTIEKTDIKNKVFHGTIISNEKVKYINSPLPSVILNVSMQKKSGNIKKIRRLVELDSIRVINETNIFNQETIMDMLSSDCNIKQYILQNKKSSGFMFEKSKQGYNNFIVMPRFGSDVSKVIYLTSSKIGSEIRLAFSEKYWLILRTPDILMYKDSMPIIRCYLQKNINSTWEFISSIVKLKDKTIYEDSVNNLDSISVRMINYIGNFMPDLGCCFIDFIVDSGGNPYFLHLGGFDKEIFKSGEKNVICEKILMNFTTIGEDYTRKIMGD